jgi:hypothetical protein
MTQYIDWKSIFTLNSFCLVLMIFLTAVPEVCAVSQFELNGSIITSTKSSPATDATTSATPTGNRKMVINALVKYWGSYKILPKLELLLQENYDGILPVGYHKDSTLQIFPPVSEKMVPSSNFAGIGLRSTAFGDVQLLVRNVLYFDPAPIGPEYLNFIDPPASENNVVMSMKRQARTNVDMYLSIPAGIIEGILDFNYYTLNYSRTAKTFDLNTFTYVPFETKDILDQDLISYGSLRCKLPADMLVNAGVYLKQNFSGHAFMNLYQYELLLQGSHQIPANNKVTWATGLEMYNTSSKSIMPAQYIPEMESHSFTTKPIYKLYLRDVYTLDWGLFLKGIVMLDAGKDLFKERYEFSLRKAWKNESSVDIGYFNALGGLFPMQGIFLRTIYRPTEQLSFSLNTKSLWEGPDKYLNEISYLKTLVNLEIARKFFTNYEFSIGGDYIFYNTGISMLDQFPGRFSVSGGIRGWL